MENSDSCLTERVQITTAAEAELGLIDFIKRAWPVVEPSTPFVWGWHLGAIAKHLEAVTNGTIQNLLINLPPRHMKSLTVSVFWPVWEWIRFPHRRWLFASYALSLSVRDSLKCRRLIESPWFQERWGDRFQLTGDQNRKERFENNKTGHRIATSVGGSATGEGGDRVVVDDPHNVRHRESDPIRRATLVWWDETMSTRLNDPKTGARVIVMQRIHEKDLSGHVLEQGGYEHLCLPAEFEPARKCTTKLPWSDERKSEGELLWQERISRSEISDFKLRLGPSGYAGQFQQRPAPAGGARFRLEWFRYYERKDAETPDDRDAGTRRRGDAEKEQEPNPDSPAFVPASPCPRVPASSSPPASCYCLHQPDGSTKLVRTDACSRLAVMDPAGTEPDQNSRPCYTVIQVWDVTPDHEMILVHQYRAQVQAPDAAEAAIRIAREFTVPFIGIEKDGIGLGIVQTVKRAGIAVRPIKARGSKEARSETAEIRMAAGTIYFPKSASYLWDLQQELLHFPRGEYSDQVDALAHAAMQVPRLGGPPLSEPDDGPIPIADPALDPDNDDSWV